MDLSSSSSLSKRDLFQQGKVLWEYALGKSVVIVSAVIVYVALNNSGVIVNNSVFEDFTF
jgi:hypothetical protein